MTGRTHWTPLAAIALMALVLAGCGIDEDQLGRTAPLETSTTTTTTAPAGGGATEPPGSTRAADHLLSAEDLGSGWTAGSPDALPDIPTCAETSPTTPLDHAQAVFVRGGSGQVLLQTVAVFESPEEAARAVAGFESDIESCDNPAVEVQDLPLPEHGDEQVTARLAIGEPVLDASVDLACVRVGRVTTVLFSVTLTSRGTEDFDSIVGQAAAKL
jgi:hypothetical protein